MFKNQSQKINLRQQKKKKIQIWGLDYWKLLEILNDCIVFHNKRIYMSAFI